MNTKAGILKSSRIFVLFTFTAIFLLGQSCFAYSGGTGTADDPYQIATPGDLIILGMDTGNYDKYFILTADINLSANNFTTAVIAIGADDEFFGGVPFAGNFNGNGYTISNLAIDAADAGNDYLGLFGKIDNGAEVKDLRLENVKITGGNYSSYIGGLAGSNSGDINNCSSTGSITSGEESDEIGGLVGWNSGGTINNCHSSVTVTSGYYSWEMGGLVAWNDEGIISNCYTTGSVSGTAVQVVGGLVASNDFGTITNCYSTGDVNGQSSCGGLIGSSEGGYISDSYSTGRISGEAFLGGLIGENRGDVNNCYSTGSVIAVIFENEVSSVGGLVGNNESGVVYNCYSTGSVTGGDMASSLGGLVGMNDEGDVNNCYSTGSVTGGYQATDSGGLIGYNSGNISDCCSAGAVSVGENSFNIGGLTGSNSGGNISNCYFTGTVTGGDHLYDVGGLVGWNYSNIANCYSTGAVISGDDSHDIGGLVGGNEGGINNCYSTGSVAGGGEASSLGGLVGYTIYTNISDCYSTGNVTGPNDSNEVGGLVGYNYGSNIDNCYSTGTVTGPNDSNQIGGLVGGNDEEGNINNSYFLNTSGPDNGCGTSLTDAQMKQQASFVGWDFVDETVNGPNDFWMISEGDTYPTLRVFSTGPISKYSGGTGTVNHPYQIANAADLLALAVDANDYGANFILTVDIDLSPYAFSTAVIAGDANNADFFFSGVSFSGRFDGNGHKISNLTIKGNGSGSKYLGLFGSAQDSTIKSLQLENVRITGGNNSSCIGGLVGSGEGSIITNCSSTGTITGTTIVGGLVGESRDSSIINCSFVGSISGVSALGGLVGECDLGVNNAACACVDNRYGDINNCYASGSVTGSSSYAIGGLIGSLRQMSASTGSDINCCYAACKVTAEKNSNSVGGLIGMKQSRNNNISNSFFLKGSSPDNSFGEPLTDSQMKQRTSFTGWDFNKTWCIFEGVGYPKFTRQWSAIQIDKCTVTAGRNPNSDKISFSGAMTPTIDDFYLTNFIQIFIDSCDMTTPCVVMIPISSDNYRKTGQFSYSGTDVDGVNSSFKLDFKTHKFSFSAQDVNLSRLSCPLSVGVVVARFEANTDVGESIVNGSKPIPIKLLMGVKNSMRVDKTKFTRDKNTGNITHVAVSGGFSVKNLNDANLAANPFVVTVGSQTFTIPANTFKDTRGKLTCSKVKLKDGSSNPVGIAAAAFDFNKSTFVLAIKGTKITDPKDYADFEVEFDAFSESAEFLLP